ncbi:caspase domain-containing protein [Mycena vitilis]|nr:caspase domain-containing protein [Mycena vitilis]
MSRARKKAFLIGISGHELEGPHEDIISFRELLKDRFGFQDHDIIVMLDDGMGTQPTEANIMATLKTFLAGQSAGDLFVFVYAGHAKQRVCLDGSERDGFDEAIIACDEDEKTILDNASLVPIIVAMACIDFLSVQVLHDHLVKPLATGSRLVAFFDTCSSETLLDLDHHVCNRPGRFRRAVRRLRELTGIPSGKLFVKQAAGPRFCSGYCPRTPSDLKPDVICFSACKDSQRVFEGKGDSMLRTVIDVLNEEPNPTLKMLRHKLNKSARHIYRRAKRSNEGESLMKQNHTEGEQGSRADDESDLETLCEVRKWAPQISSTVPLRMDRRLTL